MNTLEKHIESVRKKLGINTRLSKEEEFLRKYDNTEDTFLFI